MKILFIHNNNFPLPIRRLLYQLQTYKVVTVSIDPTNGDDCDSFIDKTLPSIFNTDNTEELPEFYDLIVLPFTFSDYDPLEYSGIRFAAHIRLDNRYNNARTPILFLGPDKLEEVLRLSRFGSFLLTPGVYLSDANTEVFFNELDSNRYNLHRISDAEYSILLNRFEVKPAANYLDSHHSETNRWSLLRWREMFDWGESKPQLDSTVDAFKRSLYFKWLQVKIGEREHFNKLRQKEKNVNIPNINGKAIVFIDDEVSLGWGSILDKIFKNSNASFTVFEDYDIHYSREQLVDSIKQFIDVNSNADCFILDLRLHGEDHSKDYKRFGGHQIASYIYEKNHGAQIVIFTASEKVMNYTESERFFSDYVMKENPRDLLGRKESREKFDEFARAIQKACSNAYLRDYYSFIREKSKLYAEDYFDYLYDFFEILRNDEPFYHNINMRSAALNLIVFIEEFILKRYEIQEGRYIVSIQGNFIKEQVSDLYIKYINPPVFEEHIGRRPPGNEYRKIAEKPTDIGTVCSALYLLYDIGINDVNKVLLLKDIRNKSVAHGNDGPVKIEKGLLKDIFECVVKPLLSKTTSICQP